jgi:hypothetical protein
VYYTYNMYFFINLFLCCEKAGKSLLFSRCWLKISVFDIDNKTSQNHHHITITSPPPPQHLPASSSTSYIYIIYHINPY